MSKFNSTEWDNLFGKLLFDIQRKGCVLMVGPEIVQLEGVGLQRHLREYLQRQNKDDIEHFYEKEALFLFKNPSSKTEVQRNASQYYHKLKPNDSVFKEIVGIPFPLIISVNPDNLLAKEYGEAPHFEGYFNHHAGSNDNQKILDWSGQTPLIYNLCGNFQEDASMLLDYDDLFSFMKTVLGPVGLPDNVRSRLRMAKSFLFIGFQFDKWYTQLLLRLLNDGNSPTQIALNTQMGDADAHHFLLKRYNMQFLGETIQEKVVKETITGLEFLTELNKRWKNTQAEQISDNEPLTKASVRRMLERGELEQALDTLPKLVADPEDRDMLTLLSNWYVNWKKETQKGVEDNRTLENRYNKVLNGVLEQLKNLPE
ncbi:MAG: SIR2 family protein [Saprospiraceae bacterium]